MVMPNPQKKKYFSNWPDRSCWTWCWWNSPFCWSTSHLPYPWKPEAKKSSWHQDQKDTLPTLISQIVSPRSGRRRRCFPQWKQGRQCDGQPHSIFQFRRGFLKQIPLADREQSLRRHLGPYSTIINVSPFVCSGVFVLDTVNYWLLSWQLGYRKSLSVLLI